MEEIQKSDLRRGRMIVERALSMLRDILTQAASFLVLNSSYLNDMTGRPQHNIPIRLVLSTLTTQVEPEDLTSI